MAEGCWREHLADVSSLRVGQGSETTRALSPLLVRISACRHFINVNLLLSCALNRCNAASQFTRPCPEAPGARCWAFWCLHVKRDELIRSNAHIL